MLSKALKSLREKSTEISDSIHRIGTSGTFTANSAHSESSVGMADKAGDDGEAGGDDNGNGSGSGSGSGSGDGVSSSRNAPDNSFSGGELTHGGIATSFSFAVSQEKTQTSLPYFSPMPSFSESVLSPYSERDVKELEEHARGDVSLGEWDLKKKEKEKKKKKKKQHFPSENSSLSANSFFSGSVPNALGSEYWRNRLRMRRLKSPTANK